MIELELKAVVPDLAVVRRRVEEAGARLTFAGRLEDRRYDRRDGSLAKRDHVLRIRIQGNIGHDPRGSRSDAVTISIDPVHPGTNSGLTGWIDNGPISSRIIVQVGIKAALDSGVFR